jgi:hypothetical protein
MNGKLAAGVVIGLACGASCSEITTPSRTPRYLSDVGTGVFHWPADRVPVRYYATTQGTMTALVRKGLRAWEGAFLYGEFTGVLVGDSNNADVIVVWRDSVPPDVPPDTAGAVGACDGRTTFLIDSTDTISEPIRTVLYPLTGYTLAQVAACMPRAVAHELGHTLGIFTHSPASGDLMFAPPRVDSPSARDRATVEVLYHSTPTIGPPPP